jgi:hypothetical protein
LGLPVLEVDWQIVAQSHAINRYVGRLPFSFWKSRKGQRKQLFEGSIPFHLTRLRSGSKRMDVPADRLAVADLKVFVWIRHLTQEHLIMCRLTCPIASRQAGRARQGILCKACLPTEYCQLDGASRGATQDLNRTRRPAGGCARNSIRNFARRFATPSLSQGGIATRLLRVCWPGSSAKGQHGETQLAQ